MTPKEAIDYLIDPIGKRDQHDKAIDLAIEALKTYQTCEQIRWERDIAIQQLADLGYSLGEKPKASCSETPNNLDCISRQAAINAIRFGITYVKKINVETGETESLFEKENRELENAILRVSEIPSVQLEEKGTPNSKWVRVSADRYTRSANYIYECSKCGEHTVGMPCYCPNCGAKMEVRNGNH